VRPPDALVVAGHVEHGNAGKCLSCLHDAIEAVVEVVDEDYDDGGGVR
jgi:hypothetical protein